MRTTLLLAIALPTLVACASTRAPAPDTPAQLIGCNAEPPRSGAYQPRGVLLRFTVDETGRPLVGTARFTPASTSATPTDSEIAEARQILASCTFRPALHGNEPVRSQLLLDVPLNSRIGRGSE
jgi:hypothetical protein